MDKHDQGHETNETTGDEQHDAIKGPFWRDFEGLRALASEKIVKRGVGYFKEHRVMEIDWDEQRLRATVEGSDPDHPYGVEIEIDEEGELVPSCSCPFDWEPVCKHVIAALLAYSARQPITEADVTNASDEALEARLRKAQTEVVVDHVSGEPEFGTWNTRSVDPTGGIPREYRVQIRSRTERLNRCSCDDFATNQLGTCKHIEAVLYKLQRRRGGRKWQKPPVPVVYLDWDGANAPRVRVRRPDGETPELTEVLDRAVDETGFLTGELPGALHRLEQEARRFGIDVGDDAHEFAVRMADRRRREQRQTELLQRIQSEGVPGVRAELYSYQVEGVAFLAANGRALLADDMGLGKTLQAIAASVCLRQDEGVKTTLVVCPASLKHQWAREIQRFTDLEVEVIQGGVKKRRAQYRRHAPFTVMNYELVLRDYLARAELLSPDLLVLDEAQRIKNWRTKTATAVKTLPCRFAFVLSGTPLENRLEDLYSVMQVVDPHVLGPLWRYLLEFHVTDERGKVLGYRNLSALRRRLEPVVLRRERSLVADQLPERVEQQRDVELTPKQQLLHDEALSVAARLAHIARRRPLTPSEEKRMLSSLATARRACDAAGLVDGETVGSPKLAELERLLDELCVDQGAKVVVFSEWKGMTQMAQEVGRGLGLGTVHLHGGVPTARRGALIERFESDPDCSVFFSTDAGGVGLNLQAANALINLELPWNPAKLDQRIGRIHRLGQRRTTQVVLLVTANSYEEKIQGLLGGKRALFSSVIGEDGGEDVVGLNKRMIDVALATLGDDGVDEDEDPGRGAGASGPSDEAGDPIVPPVPDDVQVGGAVVHPLPEDTEVERSAAVEMIQRLQEQLGGNLERVVITRAGLMAVVDRAGDATSGVAASLSERLPVAIVDGHTFGALRQLGLGFPLDDTHAIWSRAAGTLNSRRQQLTAAARRGLGSAWRRVRARLPIAGS